MSLNNRALVGAAVLIGIVLAYIAGGMPARNEASNLRHQVDSLKQVAEAARMEVDEIRNGASFMIWQAGQRMDRQDYSEARELAMQLVARHPQSAEAVEAKELIASADAAIKQAADERRLKEEQDSLVRERELARAAASLANDHDPLAGITWYRHKTSPAYTTLRSAVFLHFGQHDEGPLTPLRLEIDYVAQDWLFIESYTLLVDGETYKLSPAGEYIERDNDSVIRERIDFTLGTAEKEVIRHLLNAEQAVIRHVGRQGYRDRAISDAEKTALKDVLLAYQTMGGDVSWSGL